MATGRARRLLQRAGYQLVRRPIGDQRAPTWDFSPQARRLFEQVRDYTLTSPERVLALHDAVRYVVGTDVPGAIVECGVWRGGSMMAVAQTLVDLGVNDRELYLYDTFEGPPTPTEEDIAKDPKRYAAYVPEQAGARQAPVVLQLLPIDEIKHVMHRIGYPDTRMHFVVGNVQHTIPVEAPDEIALLRLDTDSYSSTRFELEQLYPRVADGGIVIIDDYASYRGARDATDEFFAAHGPKPFLQRIDPASRMILVRR
jgi:O-methyltransferase